jgi:hypothetical protein
MLPQGLPSVNGGVTINQGRGVAWDTAKGLTFTEYLRTSSDQW